VCVFSGAIHFVSGKTAFFIDGEREIKVVIMPTQLLIQMKLCRLSNNAVLMLRIFTLNETMPNISIKCLRAAHDF
jgi:hypothetical protein